MHPKARPRRAVGPHAALLFALVGAGAIAQLQQPQPAPDAAEPAAPAGSQVGIDEEPEAVVLLKDGQRLTGFLIEQNEERVVLRLGGIATPMRREVVDRVMVLPPVEDRYREIRAAIDDGDTDQLVRLAEWLRMRGRFDDAIAELDHVLKLEPDHPEAKRLRLLTEQQRTLRQRAREARSAREHQPVPAGGPAPRREPAAAFPLLTPEQINLIRVYEIDLGAPPRMLVDREVVTRILTEHAGHPLIPAARTEREALYRRRPMEILDLMFRLQARDLYGKVKVLEDPRPLASFREDVHRGWLINSCATTACHGGEAAGRLRLYNRRPNSDATVYTNFLILDRFRLDDGTPLVNYDEPHRSPLLHLGLPRQDSLYPHPPVPGQDGRGDAWRPALRGQQDSRFRDAVSWIRSMYRPRPTYPIDYTPPGASEGPAKPADDAGGEPAPPR